MLYLLWGLINIGLFLFFIAICFKATKLIRENLGLLASIVFVFGLLSFIGHSNTNNENKEPNSNQIRTWRFASEDSLNASDTHTISVRLEKTLIFKYNLDINYANDKNMFSIPTSASSNTTGFIAGTNWRPIWIIVKRTDDKNKLWYSVLGIVEWKLLGALIYSQQKLYNGYAIVK